MSQWLKSTHDAEKALTKIVFYIYKFQSNDSAIARQSKWRVIWPSKLIPLRFPVPEPGNLPCLWTTVKYSYASSFWIWGETKGEKNNGRVWVDRRVVSRNEAHLLHSIKTVRSHYKWRRQTRTEKNIKRSWFLWRGCQACLKASTDAACDTVSLKPTVEPGGKWCLPRVQTWSASM
jgi:hypothetical protein